MDMKQIMEMANQLRQQIESAQSSLDSRFVGEAGGGMVKVVLDGKHQAVEVKIDPTAVTDVPLLEDLLRAAFNQASQQLGLGLQRQLGSVAQGLGLDLSKLDPTGGSGSGEP